MWFWVTPFLASLRRAQGPGASGRPGWEEAAWDAAVTLSQCHSHSQGPGLLLL